LLNQGRADRRFTYENHRHESHPKYRSGPGQVTDGLLAGELVLGAESHESLAALKGRFTELMAGYRGGKGGRKALLFLMERETLKEAAAYFANEPN
jgi:hypothetical protein